MTDPAIPPSLAHARLVAGIRLLDTRTDYRFNKLFRRRRQVTIGDSGRRDIRLRNDTVSAMHAQITKVGEGQFTIEDRGSTNGVYISPQGCYSAWHKVEEPELLQLGMLIQIGKITLSPIATDGECPVLVARHSELIRMSERVYGSESKAAHYLGIGRRMFATLKARLLGKGKKGKK